MLARRAASTFVLGLLVASTSCLVTSNGDLEDPVRARPVLLPETALPDVRTLRVVEGSGRVDFSAAVDSPSDLDQSIKVRLFIDYGVENAIGVPFRAVLRGAEIAPSDSAAAERRASATWFPSVLDVSPGCHSFTLMVSHDFDDVTECPEDLDDSSSLTWHVLLCEEGLPCGSIADARLDCPQATKQCPKLADDADWPNDPNR